MIEISSSLELVEVARKIAKEAHKGQFRWDKVTPYITHPQAVACAVKSSDAKAVAWLHDVIEDTPLTAQDLINKRIPRNIVAKVCLLSKSPVQPYLDYILKIAKDEIATEVKIADLEHNLSDLDYKSNKQRYEKYQLTQHLLKFCWTGMTKRQI